ncbi:PREDICTED: uncharacterized protein LOC108358298 isoform X3 [Rhagoletis zephyria]|uniref:uncharacterized protein LOC108358298 isoform X3 n=1 Tax=Rhagoletis zephyria TaxID=28612 RepID=UPI0008114600|nr:PREDICTED: uncharacterized protein LOC108358298 isoform X3 [Rhagoletis zephyria]
MNSCLDNIEVCINEVPKIRRCCICVLNSQPSQCASIAVNSTTASSSNKEILDMLEVIFQKKCSLQSRLDRLEENMEMTFIPIWRTLCPSCLSATER